MNFTNPLVYGFPFFFVLIFVELGYSRAHGKEQLYHLKDLGASMFLGMGSVIIAALLKTVSAIVLFTLVYEFFNPIVDGVRTNIMGWQSFGYAWYVWLICQLLDDFSYYWYHRLNHKVRFLWAAHVVHHSSNHFNFGTGARNGWFTLLYKPFFYAWIAAIGFAPEMILICLGIETLWQFQLHTQYIPKLGIFDKLFNTHTMHQVHHAKNIEYMDKNHGSFLNIFDRIFGTWQEMDEEIPAEFGVHKPPNSNNPLVILMHEYKDIWQDMKKSKNWWHKFMYAFGPPGWSHDGSTQTVSQLQAEMK